MKFGGKIGVFLKNTFSGRVQEEFRVHSSFGTLNTQLLN